MTYTDIAAQLTGPGAPFEITVDDVGGRSVRNFKNRERSLRAKIVNASARGDLTCLVQGERRISYADMARLTWGAARRVAGSRIDAAEVQRHVAAHLASFKVPEFVEFTDEPLPRNPAGKLLKNLLRGSGTTSFVVDPA